MPNLLGVLLTEPAVFVTPYTGVIYCPSPLNLPTHLVETPCHRWCVYCRDGSRKESSSPLILGGVLWRFGSSSQKCMPGKPPRGCYTESPYSPMWGCFRTPPEMQHVLSISSSESPAVKRRSHAGGHYVPDSFVPFARRSGCPEAATMRWGGLSIIEVKQYAAEFTLAVKLQTKKENNASGCSIKPTRSVLNIMDSERQSSDRPLVRRIGFISLPCGGLCYRGIHGAAPGTHLS